MLHGSDKKTLPMVVKKLRTSFRRLGRVGWVLSVPPGMGFICYLGDGFYLSPGDGFYLTPGDGILYPLPYAIYATLTA